MSRTIVLFALAAILLAAVGCKTAEKANDPTGIETGKAVEQADPDLKVIVYITSEGEKYHREDCPHIKGKGFAISLAEAKKRGYTPCKDCNPPE